MNDKIERLIKEAAAKHGVAMGRDDPVLLLHTINTLLIEDSDRAQQVLLDHFKVELEGLALRWGNDARGNAEKVLNASLAASKNAMAKLMEEGAKETTASVRGEIDAALAPLAASIQEARRIGAWNVVASCITLLAATAALWSTWH